MSSAISTYRWLPCDNLPPHLLPEMPETCERWLRRHCRVNINLFTLWSLNPKSYSYSITQAPGWNYIRREHNKQMYDDAVTVLLDPKINDFHSPPCVCSDAVDKRAEARFLRQLVDACDICWRRLEAISSVSTCFCNYCPHPPLCPMSFVHKSPSGNHDRVLADCASFEIASYLSALSARLMELVNDNLL